MARLEFRLERSLTIHADGQYPVQVMKSITYTAARENLAATINRVCEDNAPVIITRNRDQSVVMLSLAEYESLEETAHLQMQSDSFALSTNSNEERVSVRN